MTTAEQNDLRLVVRLTKWALAIGFIAAFTFGVWVADLQSAAAEVPFLRAEVGDLHGDVARFQETVSDLVLLGCAQPDLNRTEQKICAKYESRMPR